MFSPFGYVDIAMRSCYVYSRNLYICCCFGGEGEARKVPPAAFLIQIITHTHIWEVIILVFCIIIFPYFEVKIFDCLYFRRVCDRLGV